MLRLRQEAMLQEPEGLRTPVAVTKGYANALSSQTGQYRPTAATALRAVCCFLIRAGECFSVQVIQAQGSPQTVSSVEWLEGHL